MRPIHVIAAAFVALLLADGLVYWLIPGVENAGDASKPRCEDQP